MEKYINDDTIIKNDLYLTFQESVVCPICSNILINPHMCMNCQNVYCKKCIDDWSKKDNKCPNRCENPNYKKSLEKNNILSKLKFECKKCKKEILYDDMKKHVDSCFPNNKEEKIDNNIIEEYFGDKENEKKEEKISTPDSALKIKRITPMEAQKLKKKRR